jgi:osmotically-inducible protein OsmY
MHIRDSLERHTEIEASKVVVSTSSNGTVILSGVADLLAEVDLIEEAAWATPGV